MRRDSQKALSRLDSETQALIRDIISILAERYDDVMAIILYGSVARREERPLGDPDPSDVDLLAVFDTENRRAIWSRDLEISHTIGLAENQHLEAQREVK